MLSAEDKQMSLFQSGIALSRVRQGRGGQQCCPTICASLGKGGIPGWSGGRKCRCEALERVLFLPIRIVKDTN